MTPRAASFDNVASSAHPNHEVQTPKKKMKDTPHFYYFQTARWAHTVTRIVSSQKSDQ